MELALAVYRGGGGVSLFCMRWFILAVSLTESKITEETNFWHTCEGLPRLGQLLDMPVRDCLD